MSEIVSLKNVTKYYTRGSQRVEVLRDLRRGPTAVAIRLIRFLEARRRFDATVRDAASFRVTGLI